MQWEPGRFAAFYNARRIAIKVAALTSALLLERGQPNFAEFVLENWGYRLEGRLLFLHPRLVEVDELSVAPRDAVDLGREPFERLDR